MELVGEFDFSSQVKMSNNLSRRSKLLRFKSFLHLLLNDTKQDVG